GASRDSMELRGRREGSTTKESGLRQDVPTLAAWSHRRSFCKSWKDSSIGKKPSRFSAVSHSRSRFLRCAQLPSTLSLRTGGFLGRFRRSRLLRGVSFLGGPFGRILFLCTRS